jgi:hypothetical protein
MGLAEKVDKLEKTIRSLLEKEELDSAAKLVLDNVDEAIRLTGAFLPEKAVTELKFKFKTGWAGCAIHESKRHGEMLEALRENRYGLEAELLTAEHPKRIEKLWTDAKPALEQRYGRTFENREEFAIMNGFFQNRRELEDEREELINAIKKVRIFDDAAKEFANKGWAEIAEMWKSEYLVYKVSECASSVVCMARDAKRPIKLIKQTSWEVTGDDAAKWKECEDKGDLTYLMSQGHYSRPLDVGTQDFDSDALDYLTKILLEEKEGKLSFRQAFDLRDEDLAKELGLTVEHPYIEWRHQLPDSVKAAANRALKKGYDNRQQGDDCSKFVDWLSKLVLERWKATGVDHDRVFSYHIPYKTDKNLMSLFYRVRDGMEVGEDDTKIVVDRLPAVLKLLVEDKVIQETDIDPPLKQKYAKPGEIVVIGNKANKQDIEKILELLPLRKKEATIVTAADTTKLLPALEDKHLPVLANSSSLEQLSKVLDPKESYYLLFKGNHTLFFVTEKYYPSGEQSAGEIYKMALLKEGASPGEGVEIQIKDKKFLVKRERAYEMEMSLENLINDASANLVPAKEYTFIVDSPVKEFRQKYFKDFMAHAIIHRNHLGAKELIKELEDIDSLQIKDLWLQLGHTGKVYFGTFEIADKFGFTLRYKNEAWNAEVLFIAQTLMKYLEDVGVGFRHELTIDESGRRQVQEKLEDRLFQKEHMGEILTSLQGAGLVKVLSYALTEKLYHKKWFGEASESCEHCGKKYIGGKLYRPDLNEQWCDGIECEDLHTLSQHPETFVNKFGNLKKIHRLLSEAKDYIPVFLSNPEILPELNNFAQAFCDYVAARSESYDFWFETEGGVNCEEETLAESPELQALVQKEKELNSKGKLLESRCNEVTMTLQKRYDAILGQKTAEKTPIWKYKNFWSTQLMIYDIYKTAAPNLLAAMNADSLNLPIKLQRG